MKQGALKDQLADSLKEADLVFCYSAELSWDASSALAPLGPKLAVNASFDELLSQITSSVRAGDHVLIMSNGGFNGIHGKLLARLAH